MILQYYTKKFKLKLRGFLQLIKNETTSLSYPKCSSEPPTKKFGLYLVGFYIFRNFNIFLTKL